METLNMAVNLNANKMVSRIAELHDGFSNTIFNATQDQLRSEFEDRLQELASSSKNNPVEDPLYSEDNFLNNYNEESSEVTEISSLDEIDTFFQSPSNAAKDIRTKSRKRRSMKDIGSKILTRSPKQSKSGNKNKSTSDEFENIDLIKRA
ncbi:hypothetical protein C1646_724299 [Rhizophagus diaphanus]|nr:hypothetical protein C1646_724299 [Rhizophagus diaphanus] [Rhizophagus sp. MUCL 43196]